MARTGYGGGTLRCYRYAQVKHGINNWTATPALPRSLSVFVDG